MIKQQPRLAEPGMLLGPGFVPAFYDGLVRTPAPAAVQEPVLAHAFACVLALSWCEALQTGAGLTRTCGLSMPDLQAMAHDWFPALGPLVVDLAEDTPQPDDEEQQVVELLARHQASDTSAYGWLTRIIARRSMCDDHLWQDLGLRERNELSALLVHAYPALAARNTGNMKWKKFFYREICAGDGFVMCAAPSCGACADYVACFGAEEGESHLNQLAHWRRTAITD